MGNTTSERISGERHTSKVHRSEGAIHHAKDHSHKIMVGSTDDPNIFSTHESKLPGEKEFVSWHHDLDESVKPSQQARPTVIRWTDGGKEVFISGSFNNWSAKIPLIKSHNDFVAILDLPEGEHQYKFFVDGQWVHDPSECDPALLPEPNHVMLNHLYALSIKDGVMVLSATHRYKKKYVTTLLYKPIGV